jgi:hypothetical protein
MSRTIGLSPKLVYAAIVGVVTFALTKLAISIDPILEQAINAVAMLAATYLAPPGDTLEVDQGPASDDLLDADAVAGIGRDRP